MATLYRIIINGHEVELIGNWADPDFFLVQKWWKPTGSKNTFEVPHTRKIASALGRLLFGKSYKSMAEDDMFELLSLRVNQLDLSVRSANCCQNAGLVYVWQLVLLDRKNLMRMKNFGRKSLTEIMELLDDMGLSLNMVISPGMMEQFSKP